jgi:hypothetical protein
MVIYSELGKPVLFPRVWWVGFLQRKYNVVLAEEHGKSESCLVMRQIGVQNLPYCESRQTSYVASYSEKF